MKNFFDALIWVFSFTILFAAIVFMIKSGYWVGVIASGIAFFVGFLVHSRKKCK